MTFYFSLTQLMNVRAPPLVVVGDRVLTDVVLAHRLRALAILTRPFDRAEARVWRWIENLYVWAVQPNDPEDFSAFVRVPSKPRRVGLLGAIFRNRSGPP